ncbi:MAG: NAD(P)H-dependent oxidoreductase [Coriobacteriia bacterium]|nr:NAD(P)H-dependent oxidoreductase [Coriobacteriia bacterium]
MVEILFISGSPRRRASVAMAELLKKGAESAGAITHHFYLHNKHIDPCVGCGSCDKDGVCILTKRTVNGKPADDYLELTEVLDRVDAVGIIAPLYFAGPTSQFKALMDRFQPYYVRRYLLGQPVKPKRPAQLYIMGSGGDPHGHEALVITTRSAFNVAGFSLEKIHDFVGFLSDRDAKALYAQLDDDAPATTELVRLRRLIARQEDFQERAVSAGSAFARYIVKQQEAAQLSAQLEELKAEMEALKAIGDRSEAASDRVSERPLELRSSRQSPGSRSQLVYDNRDTIEREYINLLRRGRVEREADRLGPSDIELDEPSEAEDPSSASGETGLPEPEGPSD